MINSLTINFFWGQLQVVLPCSEDGVPPAEPRPKKRKWTQSTKPTKSGDEKSVEVSAKAGMTILFLKPQLNKTILWITLDNFGTIYGMFKNILFRLTYKHPSPDDDMY